MYRAFKTKLNKLDIQINFEKGWNNGTQKFNITNLINTTAYLNTKTNLKLCKDISKKTLFN